MRNIYLLRTIKQLSSMAKKRLLISVIAWTTSFLAIFISLTLAISPLHPIHKIQDALVHFIFAYPWIALLVMNIAWIKDQQVHEFWPITGTIVAMCAIIMSMGFAFVIAPLGIILAIWLVRYHLRLHKGQGFAPD